MKKSNVKLLLVGACVLGALGMAGCGKKNYDTFPEKYSLASVDVGGMTAKEAQKALKDAAKKYQIAVKLDDASFDMNADELGLEYNDKTDMQMLINAANKDKEPEKRSSFLRLKMLMSLKVHWWIPILLRRHRNSQMQQHKVQIHLIRTQMQIKNRILQVKHRRLISGRYSHIVLQ